MKLQEGADVGFPNVWWTGRNWNSQARADRLDLKCREGEGPVRRAVGQSLSDFPDHEQNAPNKNVN